MTIAYPSVSVVSRPYGPPRSPASNAHSWLLDPAASSTEHQRVRYAERHLGATAASSAPRPLHPCTEIDDDDQGDSEEEPSHIAALPSEPLQEASAGSRQ